MAKVLLRGVNDGRLHLPAICIKTGTPTQQLMRLRGTASPEWTNWLILFSLFAWLITSNATARSYNVVVACRPEVIRRWHRWRMLGLVAIIAGILLVTGTAVEGFSDPLIFLVLDIAGIAMLVVNGLRNGVRVSMTADGDIELGRVHPAFRAATLAAGSSAPARQI